MTFSTFLSRSRAALLAPHLLLLGCGDAPAPQAGFPASAAAIVTTDGGQLVVEMRTGPQQPPERGVASVLLVVKNTRGEPVDGLTVVAQPWMPAMGHGAPVEPSGHAEGNGRYALENVSFFMPGQWELRTSFAGPVTDSVTFGFEIP
ncbi:MAG TPA: FixH family protein [Polyangiaceae bacterium]|nr:FixH family protein [Polyangiaceae bacterium]